jgi:hypothetical protein
MSLLDKDAEQTQVNQGGEAINEIALETVGFELIPETDGVSPDAPELDISIDTKAEAQEAIAALQSVTVTIDEQPDQQHQDEEEEELDPEQVLRASNMTAAIATGAIAEGAEFFIKGVKYDDEQRADFQAHLAAVLAKNGGAMPPWLAEFLADWEEELKLARKFVVLGWAGLQQHREFKEQEAKRVIHMPENVPQKPAKERQRVPKEMTTRGGAHG